MQEKKNNNPNEISIELPEELIEGTYANLAVISHASSEFIFDFVRLVPNFPKAKVKSRVIMTPQQAKRFMMALRENIKLYENAFGLIKEDNTAPPPFNFNTPTGQA